ncbi:MAG: pyridoxamine 5'-phosphate oxidase family protein [Oscillospiraceae bacterium]|nr:pyridoxamine 5'-phosphate oxidase family protein [Oscillospiraceae bacterium]
MNNLQEVLDFLAGKTFYLATADGDQPRVRPYGFVMTYEGRLYFANNETKPSFKQLITNPKFEISVTGDDGRQWIRVSGQAVHDPRPQAAEKAMETAPFLKEMYGAPGSPKLALFYISQGQATVEAMGDPARVFTF